MKIELRPIDAIKPYDRNPRKNDQAVEAVATSIREFGFRQPIVVDKDGVIIVGHTRWKAAKQLGLKRAPVHVATDPLVRHADPNPKLREGEGRRHFSSPRTLIERSTNSGEPKVVRSRGTF